MQRFRVMFVIWYMFSNRVNIELGKEGGKRRRKILGHDKERLCLIDDSVAVLAGKFQANIGDVI